MPDIPNLWPDDFGQPDKPTPLLILKQQGAYLGQKTGNVVIGQVRTMSGTNFMRHYFELNAPFMAYSHDLFYIEHNPIELYPVEFKGSGVLAAATKADTPEQFLAKLKEILNSDNTKKVIQALIAQSRD